MLSNQPIGTTYTMTMKFSFDMVGPSWRKIIDFRNRVPDTGFYFINGTIRFYNLPTPSSISLPFVNRLAEMPAPSRSMPAARMGSSIN